MNQRKGKERNITETHTGDQYGKMRQFLSRFQETMDDRARKDLELHDIAKTCDFQTPWGEKQFLDGCNALKSDAEIKRIQIPCMKFRLEPKIRKELQEGLHSINCGLIDDILENNDARISETVEQILWKENSIGRFLNTNSVWLNCLIFWKTILLPLVAILMPVIAFIVPYVFLKLKRTPIEMSAYLEKLRGVILQQITVPVILRSRSQNDVIGFLLERFFIAITLTTFVASIWNQITPAIHLRNIWFELDERGEACRKLIQWLRRCEELCVGPAFTQLRNLVAEATESIPHFESPVATFAYFRENKERLQKLRDCCAYIDCLLTIAGLKQICFSKSGKSDIAELRHPLLPTCVPQNIRGYKNHILLTGPNRGGKSTFLKSYALAVLLSRTWGFAWARSCSVPSYNRLHIALTPAPVLGKTSTFEAEIDAAKAICESGGKTEFILMDEIFHSTNAIDGAAASEIFLRRLYAKEGTTSVISTHYHGVAESFTEGVSHVMMDTAVENGRVHYLYRAVEGINKQSTVMEILCERGLCVPTRKES